MRRLREPPPDMTVARTTCFLALIQYFRHRAPSAVGRTLLSDTPVQTGDVLIPMSTRGLTTNDTGFPEGSRAGPNMLLPRLQIYRHLDALPRAQHDQPR